jgi:hypothetical protein
MCKCSPGTKARCTFRLVRAKRARCQRGRAYARECPQPGQEIELVVVQGGQTYRVPSEKLTISKTGDGIPVEISTVIE